MTWFLISLIIFFTALRLFMVWYFDRNGKQGKHHS